MSDQQLTDRGKFGKYFTQMYNMADDDLNPYQYRLLAHYKRVCGEDNSGVCFESTRTTAKICQMSTGKVSKVRWELVTLGYIEYHEAEGTDAIAIIVLDRMLENVQRYVERNEQRANERKQRNRSPHEQQRSPYERTRSPDEPEEERSEEEPEKKDSDANASSAPTTKEPKPKAPPKPREREPLFDAVALHLFGIEASDKVTIGGRIGKAKKVFVAHGVTDPQTVKAFTEWYQRETKGKSPPRDPDKVEEHLLAYLATRRPAQQSQNGATHYRDELDKALKQAVHPLTGEALTAAQVSIAYDALTARYASHDERLAALPDILERV